MEILFKQANGMLEERGIEQCYLKRILPERDRGTTTKKRHHHTGFEIHIIEDGYQCYEVEDRIICLSAGQFLLIPPMVRHRVVDAAAETSKYSLSFCLEEGSAFAATLPDLRKEITGETPMVIGDGIFLICRERQERLPYGLAVIEGRMLECILHFLRMCAPVGICEVQEESGEDFRVTLAKQYIQDNICQAVTVADIASYCYLSAKQLTRIFEEATGMAVAAYVRRQRCLHIEKLLSDTSLSLREISEQMNFGSECYFHAFFKKYAGMTPGAYRRAVRK